MKVLHISEYCHAESVGGTERYLLELIRGLAKQNVESSIGWLTSTAGTVFESDGVAIHPLPGTVMRVDRPPVRLTARATELVGNWRPELIHFHSFGMAEAEIARIARSWRIPYVFTYHSPGWMCRREDLMIWDGSKPCDAEVRTWRCSACKLQEHFGGPAWSAYAGAILSWPLDVAARHLHEGNFRRRACFLSDTRRFRRALREFLQSSAHVVSCSEWGVPKLTANGADARNISVIPQGVSEEFMLAARSAEHSTPTRRKMMTIGYVGRVVPVKGVDILAKAFTQVRGDDVRLRIFGWESDRAAGAFTRGLAELARRDSRIELHPKRSLSAMPATYHETDLLAIPSVWPETGPLVLFEALQMGVPVFGSDRLGHPSLLNRGGEVVRSNTSEGWTTTLEKAIREFRDGNWDRRVQKVRDMRAIRSMKEVTKEMLELYRDVGSDEALVAA